MCLCVLLVYVWALHAFRSQKVVSNPLELGLKPSMKLNVSARNWTHGFWKSSQYSWPLSHLSSPPEFFFFFRSPVITVKDNPWNVIGRGSKCTDSVEATSVCERTERVMSARRPFSFKEGYWSGSKRLEKNIWSIDKTSGAFSKSKTLHALPLPWVLDQQEL